MNKSDIICYLKILGGLLIVSPLVIPAIALDFGLLKALFITFVLYIVLMLFAIPLFNYIEYRTFRYIVKDKYKKIRKF